MYKLIQMKLSKKYTCLPCSQKCFCAFHTLVLKKLRKTKLDINDFKNV